ncbi:MAG TPA: hypothetical protein VNT60_06055 [Deinococcales bacterium]|nr:hypothetical protein [Deinococcales bacterium]
MTNFNLETSTSHYLNDLRSQASQYRAAADAKPSRQHKENTVTQFARKAAPAFALAAALLVALGSSASATRHDAGSPLQVMIEARKGPSKAQVLHAAKAGSLAPVLEARRDTGAAQEMIEARRTVPRAAFTAQAAASTSHYYSHAARPFLLDY